MYLLFTDKIGEDRKRGFEILNQFPRTAPHILFEMELQLEKQLKKEHDDGN